MSISLSVQEFALWSRYIYEICGIHLDSSKSYLVETRLKELLRTTGARSYGDLYGMILADASRKLRRQVIESITTNETSFFRDASPFELLRHKLIPELIDRRRQQGKVPVPIRIWSAACSSGQEVYSIAFVLKELLGNLQAYDIRILGTDISDKMVAQASRGFFSALEVGRGLPPEGISRHFVAEAGSWKVRDEIRALTSFRTLNLLEPFSFPVPFDIILCRNVAIYFNEADKVRLFRAIGRCLSTEGVLLIGATESLSGLCPEYVSQRYHRSVFYHKA